MSPSQTTDVHPVLGNPDSLAHEEHSLDARLTRLYKENAPAVRMLFKVVATFGFLIAVFALMMLAG